MVSVSVRQNPAWAVPDMPRETNRHRKGDTHLIGGKPHDPLDPGPWLWKADPSYQRDQRIGRHRRGELPDPPRRARRPRPHREPLDCREAAREPASFPGPVREPVAPLGRLREDAWDRFLHHSAELAEAHRKPRKSGASGPARRLLNRLRKLFHA